MTLTLNIPEPVLRSLEAACGDVPRAVLEGFAADAYRTGTISRAEVGQILVHQSIWETEAFLSQHDAWPAPSAEELKSDIGTLRDTPLP